MKRSEPITDMTYWDNVWSTSRAPVRRLPWWHPFYGNRGLFTRMVERELGDLRGARVLDVGAGGTNYRSLALALWAGAKISAIDYSPVGLEILRGAFAANGVSVATHLGDFMEYDFGGETFDVVVHWGVLEHFVDPGPLLRASAKVLRPRGRTLFSMPNMEALAARLWQEWSPENWSKHVFHSEEMVRHGCDAAGLRLDRVFHFGVPFIYMGPFERGNFLVSRLLGYGQRILDKSSLVLRHIGWESRLFSKERGFVATRV